MWRLRPYSPRYNNDGYGQQRVQPSRIDLPAPAESRMATISEHLDNYRLSANHLMKITHK